MYREDPVVDKPAEPDAEPLKPEDEETQEVQGQEVSYALLLPLEAMRLHLRHHWPCGLFRGSAICPLHAPGLMAVL